MADEKDILEAPQVLRTVVESDNPDSACEKWEYKPVIIKLPHKRAWFNLGGTFYRASYAIIEGIVRRSLFEEIEGPAAIYLFRHFLELTMKESSFGDVRSRLRMKMRFGKRLSKSGDISFGIYGNKC